MTLAKSLELILELAEGNMLCEINCIEEGERELAKEARRQKRAGANVEKLIELIKGKTGAGL